MITVSAGKYTGPYGNKNWNAAKFFCEVRGQRIMTIDSQEEEDYVNENLNPTTAYKSHSFILFTKETDSYQIHN